VSDKFSQFVRERQYLQNVSPATVEWYKHSFKWLRTENPSEQELKDAVIRMREKGLKATGCNSAIRAINAYLKWIGSPHRLRYLKKNTASCRPSQHRTLRKFLLTDPTRRTLSAPITIVDSCPTRHRLPDRRGAEPQSRRL